MLPVSVTGHEHMSNTPEPQKEPWITRSHITGAVFALIVGFVLWFIQQLLTSHPDVTALCTPSTMSGAVYTEQYVNTLLTDIDKLKAASGALPDLGQHGMDRLDAKVGGEVTCAVKNTGSTKAADIQITMPQSAVALYVGGEPIAFDPKRPMYKLPSLNPGDSFTIVAQYHGFIPAMLRVTPPNITYADGTSTVQIEELFHGFPAMIASIFTSGMWILLLCLFIGISSFGNALFSSWRRARKNK
jgi:hypothetical protein